MSVMTSYTWRGEIDQEANSPWRVLPHRLTPNNFSTQYLGHCESKVLHLDTLALLIGRCFMHPDEYCDVSVGSVHTDGCNPHDQSVAW